ncbi:MAG: heavy metal translocating P-type ATPase [Spirochaetia bacterium]|nr:heavy metal translocating P-type ATPase [Spirochaetia bacterium]
MNTRTKTTAAMCHHCGTQIAGTLVQNNGFDFCCSGCSTAYEVIRDSGLLDYYANRNDFGSRPIAGNALSLYDAWEEKLKLKESIRSGSFVVEGMHCASCVWLSERVLKSIPGVIGAEASLMGRRLILTYDQRITNLRRIAAVLQGIGYNIAPVGVSQKPKLSRDLLKRMGVAGFFAGNLMLIAVALYSGYFSYIDRYSRNLFHIASLILTLPVVFYSAQVFFKNAWLSIRHRMFSMDLLTSAGISLAFTFSTYNTLTEQGEVFFDSIGFVTFILLTGRFIENRLMEKNQTMVENLSLAIPDIARRITDGGDIEIPSSQVEIGDELRIFVGESVPADGILRQPALCEFDESLLTGEFTPVVRNSGALVLGGSRVLQDIILQVTATPAESVIGHIQRAAENPEPPTILRITQVAARWFLAFAFIAAIVTFASWWIRGDHMQAVISTVALLIAACPCALSMAVPTAYNAGLELALRAGIILKHGRVLEDLARVGTLALDKTGTLTRARPRIVQTHAREISEFDAIRIGDYLQSMADAPHPLRFAFAEANLEYPEQTGTGTSTTLIDLSPDQFTTSYEVGQGIVARGISETWLLGSATLLANFQVNEFDLLPSPSGSPVYLARVRGKEATCLAVFFIEDELRPGVARAISALKKFLKVEMLTGDGHRAALEVARATGIDRVHADLTPFEKERIIRSLRESTGVCMVGDGINDGAALASADVGIAFATTAQIPLTGAHCVIPGKDPEALLFLFRISKQTRAKIIQNLIISFIYNLCLIPMAMYGWIIPLTGALFMSASSLTVLLNSLSLLRMKKEVHT